MRLLQRADVEATFVRADSLFFEVAFPAQVSAFNPSVSWQAELDEMATIVLAGQVH